MGEVPDFDDLPRVRPLSTSGGGGGGAKPGRPPKGGVEDLVFTQKADGSRRMDYSYQGENYYIRYKPTGTANCYDYITRTVTNDGQVIEGEYCR